MGSWELRRRTGMAVNHTPILLYGKDQSLQSIKKKKKKLIVDIRIEPYYYKLDHTSMSLFGNVEDYVLQKSK